MTRIESKKGFTLVELLVVISIIAVLVSILLPALSNARESAKQVVCMAHLKQVGYGMLMYTIDNNDKYPDKYTVGGFAFRAEPGYVNPDDPRGLPETYGLAAVLDDGGYMEGNSDVWVCPGQKQQWMCDLGNTYAFSIARKISELKIGSLKRKHKKMWLIWDNYVLKPYTPGVRASGSASGYAISWSKRKYPHSFGKRRAQKVKVGDKIVTRRRSANVFYVGGNVGSHCDQ